MTTTFYAESQTTKKFGLPLSHLDYKYIESCTNDKELEKIVLTLRSGEEGKFPDLESFAENRLKKLCPKSHVLRKERPILRPGDLESGDWRTIEEDLKTWTTSMCEKNSDKSVINGPVVDQGVVEVVENLPPVRSSNIVLEGKKQKKPEEKKKKVLPRDYKEWDKFDIDAELKSTETNEAEKTSRKAKVHKIPMEIDTPGMSEQEKDLKANREKDKGNEAFKSQDFEEAVTYYSRSISLMPISASFNNRALAYLKLKKWDKAIKDCNSVLKTEEGNIKALLRRGTAYKSKKDLKKAVLDFEKVLKLEPNNKRAEELLKETKIELSQEEEKKEKGGGKRMVIEEVDSEDDDSQEIEVDKPISNGYGLHKEFEGQHGSHEHISSSNNKAAEYFPRSPQNHSSNTPNLPESKSDSSNLPQHLTRSSEGSETEGQLDTAASSLCSLAESSRYDGSVLTSQTVSTPGQISVNLPPVSPHPCLNETLVSLNGASLKPSFQTPELEVASNSHFSLSRDESQPKHSSATSTQNDIISQNNHSRPKFVQLPWPAQVLDLKEQGNHLFRVGQYADAVDKYTQAIDLIEKEADQQVNKAVLLINRAGSHLKTGNLDEVVSDCSLSLQLLPQGAKALLRRAAAYEGLEKFSKAYVDYKHVISLDSSSLQAQQGASRCQRVLQTLLGPTLWRQKIPALVSVREWEVPQIVQHTDEASEPKSYKSLKPQASSQKCQPVPDLTTKEETAPSVSEAPLSSPVSRREQTSLVGGQKPPSGHVAPPAHSQEPPFGYVAPPAHSQEPSSGHVTPPAHSQEPPSGHVAPPAHSQVPPTGHVASPAHSQEPPSGHVAPPAHSQEPPTGHVAPPAHSQEPPSGHVAPPAHSQEPPSGHVAPPQDTQSDRGQQLPQPSRSSQSQTKVQSTDSQPQEQLYPPVEFQELKAKGNLLVQKGKYAEAAECYTTCISLCPEQVACYTNRALCYLKLNQARDAEMDCGKALSLESNNPKALYRRALAHKMCQKYRSSMQDLVKLLQLEPKNTAAQKEMDIVKHAYKLELEKQKKKTTFEEESKVRKRMKIEEVDDDEEEEKSKSKVTEKSKAQKLRGVKQQLLQQTANGKSKSNSINNKKEPQVTTQHGQHVAPPIAPRLMKTTPYEFYQAWNSLKSCTGIQPYADILRQISPTDLPSVISNKLDGQMLQMIVCCVHQEMVLKGDIDLGYQMLDRLCQVPRFSTVSMFMTSKEKKEVAAVLDILSKTTSSAYTSADIIRLKKEYSVK